MRSSKTFTIKPALPLIAVALVMAAGPAFAQAGGLDKANDFMDMLLSILRGISIGVVTLAVMWCGFQFVFKSARFADLIPVIGGALLVGAAAEIARMLLG